MPMTNTERAPPMEQTFDSIEIARSLRHPDKFTVHFVRGRERIHTIPAGPFEVSNGGSLFIMLKGMLVP